MDKQPTKIQQGFTLLEVLVAMVLMGFGLAVAFTAVSGTARLDEKITGHSAAMVLARSKLDEVLANPAFEVATDAGEDRYAGTDFGYRIKTLPVLLMEPRQQEKIPAFQSTFEALEVEVFWGPKNRQQSYKLTGYRMVTPSQPRPTAGAPARSAPTPRP